MAHTLLIHLIITHVHLPLTHFYHNHPLPFIQMDSYLRSVGVNFDDDEAAAANVNEDGNSENKGQGQEEVVAMEEDN